MTAVVLIGNRMHRKSDDGGYDERQKKIAEHWMPPIMISHAALTVTQLSVMRIVPPEKLKSVHLRSRLEHKNPIGFDRCAGEIVHRATTGAIHQFSVADTRASMHVPHKSTAPLLLSTRFSIRSTL